MPVWLLPEHEIIFPHPLDSDYPEGLMAIGGELTEDRLLLAYHFGVFPWFEPNQVPHWFFPNPRCVIFPSELKFAKSMRPYFNQNKFNCTINTCFDDIVQACASSRDRTKEGTWIGDEIKQAYGDLHKTGYAHSVEVWSNGKLVGGLYGVWLGTMFYGESMFSLASNASKFGFISFVKYFASLGLLKLIDCQIENDHMISLGARNISGSSFLSMIKNYSWNCTNSLVEKRKCAISGFNDLQASQIINY